jgi:hypothetical protein
MAGANAGVCFGMIRSGLGVDFSELFLVSSNVVGYILWFCFFFSSFYIYCLILQQKAIARNENEKKIKPIQTTIIYIPHIIIRLTTVYVSAHVLVYILAVFKQEINRNRFCFQD